jgi:hypothetical protein
MIMIRLILSRTACVCASISSRLHADRDTYRPSLHPDAERHHRFARNPVSFTRNPVSCGNEPASDFELLGQVIQTLDPELSEST